MIPNAVAQAVKSSGVISSGEFGISMVDAAFIMTILRDTLYSDKILAPLREYSANAWDANREAGKKDVPIKVILPTSVDPTLTIQDFGLGLSEEDMYKVYTQYGRSTKRNTDDAVGMLGIGSKSGFAYSDSFTITSRHDGMCRTYVAILDASKKGSINLLNEEEVPCSCGNGHVASLALPTCPPPETGVTIQIPVKPADIWAFTQKAEDLFQHFVPRPDINIKLPELPKERQVLSHGILHDTRGGGDDWVALMGCVPYHINLDQLQGAHNPEGGIGEHIKKLSGVLRFNIGDIQVSASREELEYSDSTKTALIRKFNDLVDEYVAAAVDELDNNQGITIWEKRVRVQVLNRLKLPIPKKYKELLKGHIEFKNDAKTFKLTSRSGVEICTIDVSTETRIFLRDDLRSLNGFRDLGPGDYLVKKEDDAKWEAVEKELEKISIKRDFFGVPILKLSSLNWTAPPPPPTPYVKAYNNKHRVSTFRLRFHAQFQHPWSDVWEVEKRVPTKEDVFVVLEGFKTDKHNFDIYNLYRHDRTHIMALGGTMPVIYGYKSTKKKPKPIEQCVGTHYPVWRNTILEEFLKDPKILKMVEVYEATQIVEKDYYSEAKAFTTALDLLGAKHQITKLLKEQRAAEKTYAKYPSDVKQALADLYARMKTKVSFKTGQAKKEIYQKYPLLAAHKLSELWGRQSIHWGEYVRLIDKINPKGLTPGVEEEDDND